MILKGQGVLHLHKFILKEESGKELTSSTSHL